jgi:hypothetical protein
MFALLSIVLAPQQDPQIQEDLDTSLEIAKTAYIWSLRERSMPDPVRVAYSYPPRLHVNDSPRTNLLSTWIHYTMPDGTKQVQNCTFEKKGNRLFLRQFSMGEGIHLLNWAVPEDDPSKWRFPELDAARGHALGFLDQWGVDHENWEWMIRKPIGNGLGPSARLPNATYPIAITWKGFGDYPIADVHLDRRTGLISYISIHGPIPEIEPKGEIMSEESARQLVLNKIRRTVHRPLFEASLLQGLGGREVPDEAGRMRFSFHPKYSFEFIFLQPNGDVESNPVRCRVTVDAINGSIDYFNVDRNWDYRLQGRPTFPEFAFELGKGEVILDRLRIRLQDCDPVTAGSFRPDRLGWYVQGSHSFPVYFQDGETHFEIAFPQGSKWYRWDPRSPAEEGSP